LNLLIANKWHKLLTWTIEENKSKNGTIGMKTMLTGRRKIWTGWEAGDNVCVIQKAHVERQRLNGDSFLAAGCT